MCPRSISANIINQIAGPADIEIAKSETDGCAAIPPDEPKLCAGPQSIAGTVIFAIGASDPNGMDGDGLQSFVDCLKTEVVTGHTRATGSDIFVHS